MTSEISFAPFRFSPRILETYFEWFNDSKNQKILFKQTPQSREEIKAWMVDTEKNPNTRYFFLRENNKLLGHLGLRDVSWEAKAGEIGSFVPDQKIWKLPQGKVLIKNLLEKTKGLGLKILVADFEAVPVPLWNLLKRIGFKSTPGQETVLTLSL